jgi:hypothetical protein
MLETARNRNAARDFFEEPRVDAPLFRHWAWLTAQLGMPALGRLAQMHTASARSLRGFQDDCRPTDMNDRT